MQAGRDLDAKVAEALTGDDVEFIGGNLMWFPVEDGQMREVPAFSTTWEGMRLLTEAAVQKQDIYLKVEADPHSGYEAGAWDEREWINYESISSSSAHHAVCLAFLKSMRIAI